MPQIDVAMAASLRSGWLASRSIGTDVQNVGQSFSSWDNCMAAAYCKWPVIAAIIIAGLIVLSVVSCIVRVMCCGMSCCCSCFSCLKCCGNCCGCCDPPNGQRHKHLDDTPYPPPNQGYRAPAPMMAGGIGGYEPPKYAQFEVGPNGHALEPKKVNDDALPPMPSWDTAAKKHVLTEDEAGAMEMGNLDPKTGQEVPLMSGAVPPSRTGSPAISPLHSPYHDTPGMNAQNSYTGNSMGSSGMDPHGMSPHEMGPGAMGPNGMDGHEMGPHGMGPGVMGADGFGPDAVGAGALAMGGRSNRMDPYGRNGPNDRGGFGNAPNGRGNPMDPYGRNGPNDYDGFSPAPNGRGYGPAGQPISSRDGPGRGQGFNNQYPPNRNGPGNYGPGPTTGGAYGPRQPQRQYTGDSSRGFPPPQRQYTGESNRPMIAPSPQRPYPDAAPLAFPDEQSYANPSRGPRGMASLPNNNGDFDFGDTASSRGPGPQPMPYGGSGSIPRRPIAPPQQGGGYQGSTAPPSYASRTPPLQEPRGGGGGGGGYSGYQDYSRPQAGRAPPSSEGRRREAQGWEGV